MGIGCGVSAILSRLTFGLYKLHKLKRVILNVDGEFVRFKGMIQDNLHCHDAEEAIAKSSYEYLASLKADIESHIRHSLEEVVVYMDGRRVLNKVERTEFKLDSGLIRRLFGQRCAENSMRMVWLEVGESEIQMYMKRNRDVDLNIFITGDSDIISIMYDHRPITNNSSDELAQEFVARTDTTRVRDSNRVYTNGESVRDSCLWIKCSSNIEAYGMDNVQSLMKMSPKVFRILIALCGTDFTCAVFTDTMAQLVILAFSNPDLKKYTDRLNSESDNITIVCGLIYLAINHGATLKRAANHTLPTTVTVDLLETFERASKMLDIYLHYIATGEMLDDIVQPVPIYFLRLCLFMMIGTGMQLTKRTLQLWSEKISLNAALSNLQKYRNDERIHDITLLSFEPTRKRKTDTISEMSKKFKGSYIIVITLSWCEVSPHLMYNFDVRRFAEIIAARR